MLTSLTVLDFWSQGHYRITSHEENRSRPPMASLSENASIIRRILHKILELHYNSAVPDAMEICSVIIKYILIRPNLSNRFLKVLTVSTETT